jgi:hypothetical protein
VVAMAAIPAVCCRDKVHRKMQRMSRDIRFDDVLANACQADRKSYCPDVQPVSSSSSSKVQRSAAAAVSAGAHCQQACKVCRAQASPLQPEARGSCAMCWASLELHEPEHGRLVSCSGVSTVAVAQRHVCAGLLCCLEKYTVAVPAFLHSLTACDCCCCCCCCCRALRV